MIISYKTDKRERLDKFLASRFLDYSRSYFQHLIESGDVLVNDKKVKSKFILKIGDRLKINFIKSDHPIDLKPANIPLDIIFENDDVIVINKQPGLVVHPAAGNTKNTLVNALINYYPKIKSAVIDKRSIISKARPGIVHRLDKDTSGALVVAKNSRSLRSISKQIKNQSVKKTYLALCFGWPKEERGSVVNFLGRHSKKRKVVTDIGIEKGKEAITDYKVLKFYKDNAGQKISLVEFNIKTGRTHQIRYQAKTLGIPVLGDNVYGTKESIKLSKNLGIMRQMLHAKEILIFLPDTTKISRFLAKLPLDFTKALKELS